MMPPGSVRSARQNHGPPVSGIDGPHQASSISSSAAPSRSPARMPSPVFAFAPTVQSAPIGCALVLLAHRGVVLEAAAGQHDAVPGADDPLLAVVRDDDAGDDVVLEVQVLERGVEQHRHAGVGQPGPQRRRRTPARGPRGPCG